MLGYKRSQFGPFGGRQASRKPIEFPEFGGRIERIDAAAIALRRYKSQYVVVNGEVLTIPDNEAYNAQGVNPWQLGTDKELLNSAGYITTTGMSASTLYYVYLGNSQAAAPQGKHAGTLHASATAPTLVDGVYYLGSGEMARNWRFVGYIRLNGSSQFVDTALARLVVNYYNKRPLQLKVTEATNSWTYSTQAWRSWNNSTANRVEFISNGEDAVYLSFMAMVFHSATALARAGIGLDSTSAVSAQTFLRAVPTSGFSDSNAVYCDVPSAGYHFLQLLEYGSATTTTWEGDNGAPADEQSGAVGWVMG